MNSSGPQKNGGSPAHSFYCDALGALEQGGIEFLVGGAYALQRYTDICRDTKDFDIFVRPEDAERCLSVLEAAGWQTELSFPHWLGKAFCGENFVDVIFASGNGVCAVDNEWFEHAVETEILGRPVKLCPAEEMIWSKAFIMERERYDGADIQHILRASAPCLDWSRLLRRFGPHWRVLLSHLILFGFVYPAEQDRLPVSVMRELLALLQRELASHPIQRKLCQGTLLSREQYLSDIEQWGYPDARLIPRGRMTAEEIAQWTAPIEGRQPQA
jgi:hypothetical protein